MGCTDLRYLSTGFWQMHRLVWPKLVKNMHRHPRKFPHASSQPLPTPTPTPTPTEVTTILTSYRRHRLFGRTLLSPAQCFGTLMAVAWISCWFLFLAEWWYCTVWIAHACFICSVNQHLDCLQFLAVVNKAVMNILAQFILWTVCFLFLFSGME